MQRSQKNLWCLIAVAIVLTTAGAWFVAKSRHFVESGEASSSSSSDPSQRSLPTLSGSTFLSNPDNMDPGADEWPSEAFAEKASRSLKRLKTWKKDERESVGGVFAQDFSGTFHSSAPSPIFQDESISIHRIDKVKSPKRLDGTEAIAEFARTMLVESKPRRLSIKIVHVEMKPNAVSTLLQAESSCVMPDSAVQKTSRWSCDWTISSAEPQISSIQLQSLEIARRHGATWFDDRTAAVIGSTSSFQQQLAHGLQYWLARIETAHGMNYFSKHGLAVADVNNDGRDDLYVCQPGGLPNRLYLQNADGTVSDQSEAYGLDVLDRTASALFVDLDNDGDQDAAMATIMGVLIFENVDGKRFRRRLVIEFPDIDLQGLSAVDFDNDGDLDLYQIVDYASDSSRARQGLPAFVYHNARDGGVNRLLQNNIQQGANQQGANQQGANQQGANQQGANQQGANQQGAPEWRFRDVTSDVGLHANNFRHSLAAAWEDFDNDGDQDLYVANDYGPNSLYRNDGGRFQDVAPETDVVDFGSGMSVTWGDYDRDGAIDLYVANMFSSAGSRITTQNQFLPNLSTQGRTLYRRFAKGNSLFRNTGRAFQETSGVAGVEMGRWSWSSLFCDANNDGWEDLLVANGYITTDDSGDL